MQSIDIHFKPSKTVIFLYLFLWLGSIGAIVYIPVTVMMKLLLLTIITVYAFTLVYLHGFLQGPTAITGLRYLSDDYWQVRLNKNEFTGILKGDSTVTTWVSVLRFKRSDKKLIYSYLLVRDSFEFDMYRRLLLRLRCFKSIKH